MSVRSAYLFIASVLVVVAPNTAVADPSLDREVSDLRTMLEAASKEGWVELTDRPSIDIAFSDESDTSGLENTSDELSCDAFSALTTALADENSYTSKGFLAEAVAVGEVDASMGMTLSELLGETWHDGGHDDTIIDFSLADQCDLSLLPWSVLSSEASPFSVDVNNRLTTALDEMTDRFRMRVLLSLARKAAVDGNEHQVGRFLDSYDDTAIDGEAIREERILIDAIRERKRGHEDAEAKLIWLASRNIPESDYALSVMTDDFANAKVDEILELRFQAGSNASRQNAIVLSVLRSIKQDDVSKTGHSLLNLSTLSASLPERLHEPLYSFLVAKMVDSAASERFAAADLIFQLQENFDALTPQFADRLDAVKAEILADLGGSQTSPKPLAETTQIPPSPTHLRARDQAAVEAHLETVEADIAALRKVLGRG